MLSRVEQQLYYDHLWYEGFVVPDDYPSWGEPYYLDWWWSDE